MSSRRQTPPSLLTGLMLLVLILQVWSVSALQCYECSGQRYGGEPDCLYSVVTCHVDSGDPAQTQNRCVKQISKGYDGLVEMARYCGTEWTPEIHYGNNLVYTCDADLCNGKDFWPL